MKQNSDRRPFDEAEPITTDDVVALFPDGLPALPDDEQVADSKPASSKKAGKKHPPVTPRPAYTGKRVQDSPYYIAPTDRLDLLLAVTLDLKLKPSDRDVFGLIVAHYNNRMGYAFPGRERMAELLDLTETAISTSIGRLVERKWLKVEQTRADGHKGVNHYLPQLDRVAEVVTGAGFKVNKTGRSDASKVRSSDEQGPVSQGSKVRFDEAARSAKPDANPATEPSEGNPEKEPGSPKGVVSPRGVAQGDWFSEFWGFYPHKVGEEDTRPMFESIVKSDGVLFETIMNGLETYVNKTDDRPWFNPVNWLKGKRWNDKPAPVVKRQAPAYRDNGAGSGRLAI